MFPHIRRLVGRLRADVACLAFSSPAVASAGHAASQSATRHHAASTATTGLTTRSRSTTAAITMPTTTVARAMATATSSGLGGGRARLAMLALASPAAARPARTAGTPRRACALRLAAGPASAGRPEMGGCRPARLAGTRRAGTRYGPTRAPFRGPVGSARPHPRLPQHDAPVGRGDPGQLEQFPPGSQHGRGRLETSSAKPRHRGCASGGNGFVRHRPLRDPAHARYREIACIVRGARATTAAVAAARPADWTRLAPQLERAVASFST